jgi:16S rRNA (uracil1498-N3)-methyltransferase
MHRFFISPEWIASDEVRLSGAVSRQIAQVLRLRPGDDVIVLDNLGSQHRVELVGVSAQEVVGKIRETSPAEGEPATRVTLYASLAQREKFEWILQKGTEVGMAACVPVVSDRTLVRRWDAGDEQGKRERWERILREAAEQSHRGRVPVLGPVTRLEAALQGIRPSHDLSLIPWEGEHSRGLRLALQGRPPCQIGVFIGPEGGFSTDEVAMAEQHGAIPVSLGRRILRMETAAVLAVALVLHEMGEMGS